MQPVHETRALITTEIKQTFKSDVAIKTKSFSIYALLREHALM